MLIAGLLVLKKILFCGGNSVRVALQQQKEEGPLVACHRSNVLICSLSLSCVSPFVCVAPTKNCLSGSVLSAVVGLQFVWCLIVSSSRSASQTRARISDCSVGRCRGLRFFLLGTLLLSLSLSFHSRLLSSFFPLPSFGGNCKSIWLSLSLSYAELAHKITMEGKIEHQKTLASMRQRHKTVCGNSKDYYCNYSSSGFWF